MNKIFIILILTLLISGCISKSLGTMALKSPPLEDKNFYTLIYFFGTSKNDVRRAVIIDIEDDNYEILPSVRDFEYEILQNISVPEAVWETEIFFKAERYITDYYVKSIHAPDNTIIGYEFLPLFQKDYYGQEDVQVVNYFMKRKDDINRVSLKISLKSGFTKPLLSRY